MKIIIKGVAAVMLLLGSASAYQKKDQVANELSALSNMINEMEQPNAESLFNRIVERKDQIATMAQSKPQYSERYTEELDTLANMIDAVEDEDYDVMMQLIEARKDKLMNELTLSMFEDVPTQNMIKTPKLTSDTDVKAAQAEYDKALLGFYNSLPKS